MSEPASRTRFTRTLAWNDLGRRRNNGKGSDYKGFFDRLTDGLILERKRFFRFSEITALSFTPRISLGRHRAAPL